MSRILFAEIELDEDYIDEESSPIEYVEREFGRLEQSGISLQNCIISDADDAVRWGRYIDYLIRWAIDHYGDEFDGMSPACYDEWCDNENEEN